MAFTQISTDGIKNGTITGSDFATNIDLTDSQKIRFGNSNDLQLFHDGNNSVITAGGAGDLQLTSTFDDVIIQAADNIFINPQGGETGIQVYGDGNVKLYHANSQKFRTYAAGVEVTGNVLIPFDGSSTTNALRLGASQDLQIYHDGSTSLIQSASHPLAYYSNTRHHFLNGDGSENMAVFVANGAVELYYDNSKKFETLSTGTRTSGNVQLPFVDANNGLRNKIQWVSQANFFDEVAYIAADRTATSGAVSDLVFATGSVNAVSEAMRVKAYGNVVIGGTSATKRFHVDGPGTATDEIVAKFKGGTGNNCSAAIALVAGYSSTASDTEGHVLIKALRNGSGNQPHMTFFTGNTERMRITSSGNLQATNLCIAGSGFAQFDNSQSLISQSSTGSSTQTYFIGNQAIQTSSDRRIKENIVNTKVDALSELKKVRVVDFTWNDPNDKAINNRNSRGKWTGCIAQEIVDVFPFAVNAPRPEGEEIDHDSEALWGMEYGQLVPVLIKAIQDLNAKVEVLEAD